MAKNVLSLSLLLFFTYLTLASSAKLKLEDINSILSEEDQPRQTKLTPDSIEEKILSRRRRGNYVRFPEQSRYSPHSSHFGGPEGGGRGDFYPSHHNKFGPHPPEHHHVPKHFGPPPGPFPRPSHNFHHHPPNKPHGGRGFGGHFQHNHNSGESCEFGSGEFFGSGEQRKPPFKPNQHTTIAPKIPFSTFPTQKTTIKPVFLFSTTKPFPKPIPSSSPLPPLTRSTTIRLSIPVVEPSENSTDYAIDVRFGQGNVNS